MTASYVVHEFIHTLGLLGFLLIGYELGKRQKPSFLDRIMQGSTNRAFNERIKELATKEPDPFADERPTEHGLVMTDEPAVDVKPFSDLADEVKERPGAREEIEELKEDEVEEVQRAREEPTPDLVDRLRKHVGHEVSVVQSSAGTQGVMICKTCEENVPLANSKDIVVAESAIAGPDFTAPSNEDLVKAFPKPESKPAPDGGRTYA